MIRMIRLNGLVTKMLKLPPDKRSERRKLDSIRFPSTSPIVNGGIGNLKRFIKNPSSPNTNMILISNIELEIAKVPIRHRIVTIGRMMPSGMRVTLANALIKRLPWTNIKILIRIRPPMMI